METMTLMPMAVAGTSVRRAASAALALQPFGAKPRAAAFGHLSTWSMTNEHVIDLAAAACTSRTFGTKAYGTRRLGEQTST